jgi:hypothetical protein
MLLLLLLLLLLVVNVEMMDDQVTVMMGIMLNRDRELSLNC